MVSRSVLVEALSVVDTGIRILGRRPLLGLSHFTSKNVKCSRVRLEVLASSHVNRDFQKTLKSPSEIVSGIGLHSGEVSEIRLLPANAGEGRYFVFKRQAVEVSQNSTSNANVPSPSNLKLPASVRFVSDTRLSTTLRNADVENSPSEVVQTVEHLFSALEGMGVDNVCVEISGKGSEVPILDGSASPWVEIIRKIGLQDAVTNSYGTRLERKRLKIVSDVDLEANVKEGHACVVGPISVYEGDSFVIAFPSKATKITYGIDFPQLPAVGTQWYSWQFPVESYNTFDGTDSEWDAFSASYETNIAKARTFGILEQVEQMRAAGMIKGASLENALVYSIKSGWVNPPLRYTPDEPCRHKLLDLIGDLALAGLEPGHSGIPHAHIVAFKASHKLHVEFGKKLLENAVLHCSVASV